MVATHQTVMVVTLTVTVKVIVVYGPLVLVGIVVNAPLKTFVIIPIIIDNVTSVGKKK